MTTPYELYLQKCAADDWKTRPGVRALVQDEQGRVLLLLRPKGDALHPGTWNLPGGAKEKDESHIEGAHRELKEETGLEAHATGEVHNFKFPGGQGKAYKMFLQSGKGSLNIQKKEVDQAKWFDPNKLPKKLFPNTAETIMALSKSAHERYLSKQAALLPGVKLRKHQEDAAKRFEASDGQIMLAHATGSGKTLSYISLFEKRRAKGLAHKALVITPAALQDNFIDNGVKRFTDSHASRIGAKGDLGKSDYYVTSLEKFRADPVGYMKRTGADTMIFDEMHKARDPGSKNYKAFMLARPMAKTFIGGTGSPIMNNPRDIVPLMDIVTNKHHDLQTSAGAGMFKKKYKSFDDRFIEEREVHHGPLGFMGIGPVAVEEHLKNTAELRHALAKNVHYVSAKDLGDKMPEKHLHNIEVEMSPHQQKLYDFTMDKLDPITRYKIKNNLPVGSREAAHVFTRILHARQASNGIHMFDKAKTPEMSAEETPKARRVLDDVAKHLSESKKNKAIIYTNMVHGGVDEMMAGLKTRGQNAGMFIGSGHQKKSERSADVLDYLSGKRRVMVINQAGAEGLDLPGTTAHFTLDPHFNPEMMHQSEARGIRAGSPVKAVDVYRYRSVPRHALGLNFLPRDTGADEWVQGIADRKNKLNKEMMELLS